MSILFTEELFALFFVITAGLIIGRIKIRGFSLDMSAVIFIALFLGYMGIKVPSVFKSFGLLLFIFTVGMQSGPGFFNSFLSHGRKSVLLVSILILSGVGAALLFCELFGIHNNGMILGLFNGGMTSSIGLAASSDILDSPYISIGYSIAYPFAVILSLLFFQFLPILLRIDWKKEEQISEEEERSKIPVLIRCDYLVENPNIDGKTISELNLRATTQCSISRVKHDGLTITPVKNTKIFTGDVLRIIGAENMHEKIQILIGRPVEDEDMDLRQTGEVVWVLVTNKNVIGKTLAELNLFSNYDSTIVRIRRASVDLPPSGKMKLRFGDRVLVATTTANEKAIAKFLGNDTKLLSDTDFLPITLGIVIGILLGNIQIPLGSFNFKLGLSGGVLISSLILSSIGKTGPIIWSMSSSSNILFRELGLLLFTAAIGTEAGSHISGAFNEGALNLVAIGLLIAITPFIIGFLIGKYCFKMKFLNLMGVLSGGMTTSFGLMAISSKTSSDVPRINYATVYPFGLVLMIIIPQLLALFLK